MPLSSSTRNDRITGNLLFQAPQMVSVISHLAPECLLLKRALLGSALVSGLLQGVMRHSAMSKAESPRQVCVGNLELRYSLMKLILYIAASWQLPGALMTTSQMSLSIPPVTRTLREFHPFLLINWSLGRFSGNFLKNRKYQKHAMMICNTV